MKLIFETIAIKDNTGYASNYNENGLFKVDMNTGECTFLCTFPDEKIFDKRMFSKAVWLGNLIYFIPAAANALHIFNVENNTIKRVEIPRVDKNIYQFYYGSCKFIDAVVYESVLWMIPSSYPGMLRMNLLDDMVSIVDDWIPDQGYFFKAKACVNGSKIVIPDGKSNLLLMFDMGNNTAKFERLGDGNHGVMQFCKVDDEFYFAPRIMGSIVRWNVNTGKVIEYNDYPDAFSGTQPVFSNCYSFDRRIYFSPSTANGGIVLENGKLRYDTENIWKTGKNKVEYLFQYDNALYYREFIGESDNRTYKVNMSDGKCESVAFTVMNTSYYKKEIINKAVSAGECIRETSELKLEDLLNSIL